MNTLSTALSEYDAAQAARAEVCRRDCDWPQGDGHCGYCAREDRAHAALIAAVRGAFDGR